MECDKCKRELNPTVHTRDGYKVEAYRLFTGHTTPVIFREDSEDEVKFTRLDDFRIVTICDVCLTEKNVAEALEKFEAPEGL